MDHPTIHPQAGRAPAVSAQKLAAWLDQGHDDVMPPGTLPDMELWGPMDRLSHEFQAIGFYLSAHPLDTKRVQMERLNIVPFTEIERALHIQGGNDAGRSDKDKSPVVPKCHYGVCRRW